MLICCCSKEENPIVLRCQAKSQLNLWQKVYWLILRRNVRLHVWLTWPAQDSHWRIQAEDLPASSCHHGKVWKMIQQGTPHFLCAEVSSVPELWNKILNNIIHKDHVHSILIGSRIPTLLKSMPPFPPRLAFNRNKEKWSRGLTPQHWSFIYKIAWLWNVDLYFTVTFTHFRFVCLQIFQLKVCRQKWFLIHSFSWFFKSFKLCRGWHLVILLFSGIVRSL